MSMLCNPTKMLSEFILLIIVTTVVSIHASDYEYSDSRGQFITTTDNDLGLLGLEKMAARYSNRFFQTATSSGATTTATQDNSGGHENDNFSVPFITHGFDAVPGEFKYQVALLRNESDALVQFCGGVLLSEHHVLTTAHCLKDVTSQNNTLANYWVAVGIYNVSAGLNNPGAQISQILGYKIHFDYDPAGNLNDIALLWLKDNVTVNGNVEFAQLAPVANFTQFDGTYCVVTGWGLTDAGIYPDILQMAYQYVPSLESCRNYWSIVPSTKITKRHICAYNYPTSTCEGDSGGPMTCKGLVAGLISWGLRRCNGCFPGVLTRVSFFTPWIENLMLQPAP